MESNINQSTNEQQRPQSHSREQERQERNAINLIGLRPDQTAAAAAAAATFTSNNSNGHRQQQPQAVAMNAVPLGIALSQQGNIAAVARLLENNPQAISLLGSIATQNNNTNNFNPNINGNAVALPLGGSIQGVLNLFQQRQVELDSNFQTLTRLLEAALQPNSGQPLQQQQGRQHQAIPQDPQQQQQQQQQHATKPAASTTEHVTKTKGGNVDKVEASKTNPANSKNASKKKTTEAASNGRVMGQSGGAIVPCRARGLARNHNTRTAFFVLYNGLKHGQPLMCSHKVCQGRGVRFVYCSVCDLPVAIANFSTRHSHPEIETLLPRGGLQLCGKEQEDAAAATARSTAQELLVESKSMQRSSGSSSSASGIAQSSSSGNDGDEVSDSSSSSGSSSSTTSGSEDNDEEVNKVSSASDDRGGSTNSGEVSTTTHASSVGNSDAGNNGSRTVSNDTGNKLPLIMASCRKHNGLTSSEDDEAGDVKKDCSSDSSGCTSSSDDSSDDGNLNTDETTGEAKASGRAVNDDDNRRKRKAIWAELFDKRPRNDNNDEMSAWLMATIAVSDPEGHPLGAAVRQYLSGESASASQIGSQDR